MITLNVNGINAKFPNVYTDDNVSIYYANDNTGNAPTPRFFDGKPFALNGKVDGVKYYLTLDAGATLVSGKPLDATKIGSHGGRKAAAVIDAAYIVKLWCNKIATPAAIIAAAVKLQTPGIDAAAAEKAAKTAADAAKTAADAAKTADNAKAAADAAAADAVAAFGKGNVNAAKTAAEKAAKTAADAAAAKTAADAAADAAKTAADAAATFVTDAIAAIDNDNAVAFMRLLIK